MANNGGFIEALVYGNRATVEALVGMDKRVDIYTAKALKEVEALAKRSIRSNLRGAPRASRRGKSSRTGEAVKVEGASPGRAGGAGRFQGKLYGSITGSKKPKVRFAEQSVAVFAGSKGNVQNLYKKKQEANFPYFAPGINKAVPKMPAIWHKHWGTATKT